MNAYRSTLAIRGLRSFHILCYLPLLLIASGAVGEPVAIAFGGQITDAAGSIEGSPSLPSAVGDDVVATITFDSESSNSNPSLSASLFSGPVAASFSAGGLEIAYDFVNLIVTCNVVQCLPSHALP